jgi:hypothetical protein
VGDPQDEAADSQGMAGGSQGPRAGSHLQVRSVGEVMREYTRLPLSTDGTRNPQIGWLQLLQLPRRRRDPRACKLGVVVYAVHVVGTVFECGGLGGRSWACRV